MRRRKMHTIKAHIFRTGLDEKTGEETELQIDVLGTYQPPEPAAGYPNGSVELEQVLTPGVELTETEVSEAEYALWENWHEGEDF
jgi:hypothetical protein